MNRHCGFGTVIFCSGTLARLPFAEKARAAARAGFTDRTAGSSSTRGTWVRGPDSGVLDLAAVPFVLAVQVADPSPSPGSHSLRDERVTERRLPGPVSAPVLAQLPLGVPLEVEVFGLTGDPDWVAVAAYRSLETLRAERPLP